MQILTGTLRLRSNPLFSGLKNRANSVLQKKGTRKCHARVSNENFANKDTLSPILHGRNAAREISKQPLLSENNAKSQKNHKTAFIGEFIDRSVLFDLSHVKGMYKQGFKQKIYFTIPS